MKKIILLFFLSVSMMTFGQNNDYQNVTFFGVDYSVAKVYGSDNTPFQFQDAFYGINRLFLTEPKKYNVEKFLGVDISAVDLEPVEKQIANINLSELLINGYGGYELSNQQIEKAINTLPVASKQGTGLVVVAEVLNKASQRGSYKIVFFDIPTRKVLEIREGKGKAQGFGLRNYWAHSVRDAIKKAR